MEITIAKAIDILIDLDADDVNDRGTNPEYAAGAAQALAYALMIASDDVPEAMLTLASAIRAQRNYN